MCASPKSIFNDSHFVGIKMSMNDECYGTGEWIVGVDDEEDALRLMLIWLELNWTGTTALLRTV